MNNRMNKVICDHRGGRECDTCSHNKPHEPNGCDKCQQYCPFAIDGGGGDGAKCYPVAVVTNK